MTEDGRFSWDDLNSAILGGFRGVGLGDALAMADAAVLDPVFDDGSTVSPDQFDPDYLVDGVIREYVGAHSAEMNRRAAAHADRLEAISGAQVEAGVQAVTGVPPAYYEQARKLAAAGNGDAYTKILADYVERT